MGSAPGCATYAHVRMVRTTMIAPAVELEGGGWDASASASLEGACASVGPCAGGASASGERVQVAASAESGGVQVVAGAEGVQVVDMRGAGVYGAAGGSSDASAEAHAVATSGASASADASASAYASASGSGGAGASASIGGSSGASVGVGVTGRGRGLLSIAGEGTTIDGHVVALGLLSPLAGATFSADTRVGGDASFSCDASLAHDALPAAGGATSVVVRIAGGAAPARVPPLRVHLVIDASTSMESTWGHLQDAALHLLTRLRAEDELHIVVYGTDAREALPAVRVGDGSQARRVIRALRPRGRTNIEAGLRIAYGALRPHASIVVVLSDGVPNGGLATPGELGALAAEANARGAVTTAIGIGWDFHPGILRALAEHGQGHFRIAPRTAELGAILEAEITARGRIAAHDIELSIALGPGVRITGELTGGLEATADGARLRVPAIGAGEERVLVVPVEVPPGIEARSVAQIDARWTATGARSAAHAEKPLAIAVSARPVLAGGALAVLDADLASALGLAATAVTNGDGAQAAVVLRAHASRARVHVAARPMAALDERTAHVVALATALERMVPSASWHDRRALGASMVSFSASFGAR